MPDTPEVYDPRDADAPLSELAHIPEKYAVGDALKFWALGDRVLILEDEFKSGYQCTTCNGATNITCPNCKGAGEYSREDGPTLKCSECDGSGKTVCPTCEGKGGLLIVPQTSERRPTSGRIVSAGQKCKYLREGDTVLYSNFAGYVVDLNRAGQSIVLRILHETEVLASMEGHLTLSNLNNKTDIAPFTP